MFKKCVSTFSKFKALTSFSVKKTLPILMLATVSIGFATINFANAESRGLTNAPSHSDEENPIYRIVVTGGEHGGKSTAISAIANRLMSMGFQVFIVPSSSKLLKNGNGNFNASMNPDQIVRYYGSQLEIQMALEESFYDVAKSSGKKSVIIMERGTMDASAHTPLGIWEILLDDYGWSLVHLRDKRYDGVFHLVTPAIGAIESFLSLNPTKTIDQATSLDFKLINAWIGHHHLRIFDNSNSFEEKVQRVVNSVCTLVGAPRADSRVRKFLIPSSQQFYIPIKFEEFDMEQTYLKIEDETLDGFVFVRRRGQNGVNTYTHSVKRRTGSRNSSVVERQISGREYSVFLTKADPGRSIIRKKIKTFIWKNQMFELIDFPELKVTILQTEQEAENVTAILPPFIPTEREITEDRNYHTYVLATPKPEVKLETKREVKAETKPDPKKNAKSPPKK
jgi:hypothetical protein